MIDLNAKNGTYFDKTLIITGILLILAFLIPNKALYSYIISTRDDLKFIDFTAFWNDGFRASDLIFIAWPLIAGVLAILAGVYRMRNGRFMALSMLGLMGILT